MPHPLPRILPFTVLALLARAASAGDEAALLPGLRAEFHAGSELTGQPLAARADGDVHFDWGEASPDLRVPRGPFAARWTGKLFVSEDGEYRFSAHAAGAVRLVVGGREVLAGERAAAAWIDGGPLEIPYGYHDLAVEYRKTEAPGRLGLYWRSAAFALEPLEEGNLFHTVDAAPPVLFERGLRLARALRCGACHRIPGVPPPPGAPTLASADRSLRPAYLERRLLSPRAAAPGSRMPEFSLGADEAAAVAAYLAAPARAAVEDAERAPDAAAAADGKRLVLTRGCLACHAVLGLGNATLFGGGRLDDAGSRRTAASLARFLAPGGDSQAPAVHRPELQLGDGERAAVAAFLAGLAGGTGEPAGGGTATAAPASPPAPALIARGHEVARARGCGACHQLPDGERGAPPAPALHAGAPRRGAHGCLEPARAGENRPHYPLAPDDREAVVAFLAAVDPRAALSLPDEGRLLLAERGCLACHPRGAGPGLGATLKAVAEEHPELPGSEGAWRPPTLAGAGDKFLDAALASALRGDGGARRPWLEVRMPRFRHDEAEERAITAHLAAHDRIPPRDDDNDGDAGVRAGAANADLVAAGRKLAGPEGLGCSSCHVLGKHDPGGIAATARGPDLLRVDRRLRRSWFLRWTRDPSRIAPGIEMPSLLTGRRGILGGDLDLQLEALWRAFNAEGFALPAGGGAVREVAAAPGDGPRIIRDVFEIPARAPRREGAGEWVPRGFAIGFPDGQHLLLDLDHFSPAAWWTGRFATESARGKTWLWRMAGDPVIAGFPPVPSLALRRLPSVPLGAARGENTGLVLPEREERAAGRLRSWRRAGEGVEITYEIRFPGGGPLEVTERIEPLREMRPPAAGTGTAAAPATGIRRRITLAPPPVGEPVFILALPRGASPRIAGASVLFRGAAGDAACEARAAGAWRELASLDGAPEDVVLFACPLGNAAGEAATEVAYRIEVPAAPSSGPAGATAAPRTTDETPPPPREPARLDVVPGFEALRLPIDESVMPTAFAFFAGGAVAFSSLKGDVYRLADRDSDGVEETCVRIADLLSAPYGLLAEGGDLLVSHKPELLRLADPDGDGFLDAARVVATGWGFTHDYHDWTFGLVRRGGDCHVLMGSDYQQDGRPRDATRLRGKAVRIAADGRLEEVARGLRFTAGIAARKDGEIFFTDNQGEGNPFNEINHLRAGKTYGVPSLADGREAWKERGEPPAVAVPHPWTRSVNGLAFLEGEGRFGVHEGHGIGCEYDNRMLIRFTLERAGDTFQGACYPFSRPAPGAPGFLGPIACGVSPRGDVYIGDFRDSGWGGGNNSGGIVRLRPAGPPPLGIREARAWSEGFELEFTGPVDPGRAADPRSYALSAYRRVWTGGYATPDQDRHAVAVEKVTPASGGRVARLVTAPLRAGFLYEIHVRPAVAGGGPWWPAVAYYTLNRIPDPGP